MDKENCNNSNHQNNIKIIMNNKNMNPMIRIQKFLLCLNNFSL